MAHFEAHRRFMDAIVPYFHMPLPGIRSWKAFVHCPLELVQTLRLQDSFETIDAQEPPPLSRQIDDVQMLIDDFEKTFARIAKDCACTVKTLRDEINMRALIDFPWSSVIDPCMQGINLAQLRVRSGYYVDVWLENDREKFGMGGYD